MLKLEKSFLVFGVVFGTLLSGGKRPADTLQMASKLANVTEEIVEVASYETVLETYYHLAVGDCNDPETSFEQFVDEFYAEDSERDLIASTLALAEENDTLDDVCRVFEEQKAQATVFSSSSSGDDLGGGVSGGDASYILLSSLDTSFTPDSYFKRYPVRIAIDYSAIQKGDLVYETDTIMFDIGHIALVENTSQPAIRGSFTQTIEAVKGGVQRGFLDDYRMAKYKREILRVTGRTDEIASTAISFAKQQVGKKYNLHLSSLHTSINSTSWYCSELAYAAYLYAGIDIAVTKNAQGKDVHVDNVCYPATISESYNTWKLTLPENVYYLLTLYSVSDDTWEIGIYNPRDTGDAAYYYYQTCTEAQALEWIFPEEDDKDSSASDYLTAVHVPSHDWVHVEIDKQSRRTSFAVARNRTDYYYVTCGTLFNEANLAITQSTNMVMKG